jgi:hypothetical protein
MGCAFANLLRRARQHKNCAHRTSKSAPMPATCCAPCASVWGKALRWWSGLRAQVVHAGRASGVLWGLSPRLPKWGFQPLLRCTQFVGLPKEDTGEDVHYLKPLRSYGWNQTMDEALFIPTAVQCNGGKHEAMDRR